MTIDAFQVTGDSLSGRGLSFDVADIVSPREQINVAERSKRLVEIAEVAFRQGRTSALLSWDDRFDLHAAVEALRAISVIVGPNPAGDRHRRAADIIARLLQDQEAGK